MFDCVLRHFQQCLSYMLAFSFIGGGHGGPGENHCGARTINI